MGGAATAEAGSAAGAVVSPRSEVWPVKRLLREKRRSESSRGEFSYSAPNRAGPRRAYVGPSPRCKLQGAASSGDQLVLVLPSCADFSTDRLQASSPLN